MSSFQPSVTDRLKFAAQTLVKRHPALYQSFLRIRGVDEAYFVSRKTELLIAGFGGSANSYATAAIREGCPGIHLAHHLHAVSQVVKAVRLGTPCLVLIRHPVDAISSLTTRNFLEFSVDGLGWALKDYQSYYDAIVGYREKYVSCGFKDVIEDFHAVITRVNERFGTSFSIPANDSVASQEMIAKHKTRGVNRVCAIEDVQAMLGSPALEDLRLRAECSHNNFCALTGTEIWKDPHRPPLARRS